MSLLMSLKSGIFKAGFLSPLKLYHPCSSQILRYNSGSGDKVRDRAEAQMQKYWEKNHTGPRPYSPHLLIYKMELPMTTSLLHRGSGIAMAIAWGGLGIGAFFYTGHIPEIMNFLTSIQLASPVIFGAKFILCWPLVYHYINGMRHLAYDAALGFEVKTTMNTGYMALAASLLLASIFAALKV